VITVQVPPVPEFLQLTAVVPKPGERVEVGLRSGGIEPDLNTAIYEVTYGFLKFSY
jgi:hypothetical protein